MKNKNVLSVTSNVIGQIKRKISKSKKLPNFDLFGGLQIRGMKNSDFYCKGTSLRECTLFEPFCLRSARAERVKSQKVTRCSHGNDVSPLTQGLNYRAAYDVSSRWKCLLLLIWRFRIGHSGRLFADFLKCTCGFHPTVDVSGMWQNFIWRHTALGVHDNVSKAYGRISCSFGDTRQKWSGNILPPSCPRYIGSL